MPYDIFTIEQSEVKVELSIFQITTFEMKTTAFCDCCDATATGTKTQLQNSGWTFGKGSEFCPDCNF